MLRGILSEDNTWFDTQHWIVRYLWIFLTIILGVIVLGVIGLSYLITSTVIKHRKPANQSAYDALAEGVQQKRIIQEEHYDVFIPPVTDDTSKEEPYAAGLVFVPGALVDHTAYAGILSLLAKRGIVIVLQKFEPLRMPVALQGANSKDIQSILDEIESKHGIRAKSWAVGGHSAGGSTVVSMAQKPFVESCTKNKNGGTNKINFDRLVLWGVNTTQDLEKLHHVHALTVTASKDGFKGNSMGKGLKSFDAWGKGELVRLQNVEIQGGNHGGFADYPKQMFPREDGDREITLQSQHEQVVEVTAKFLLGKEN